MFAGDILSRVCLVRCLVISLHWHMGYYGDGCVRYHGPLTRYVKLQVAHAPGMPGTFPPCRRFHRKPLVSDPGMHHGTCVTHVPWCMSGSLTCGDRGKCSRHSRRMRTRNFAYLARGPCSDREDIFVLHDGIIRSVTWTHSNCLGRDHQGIVQAIYLCFLVAWILPGITKYHIVYIERVREKCVCLFVCLCFFTQLNTGTVWNFSKTCHDDVIECKHFPRYCPFVRGIHRSSVNSPHKGQWRGAVMFSLISALNKQLSKQSWSWGFETS